MAGAFAAELLQDDEVSLAVSGATGFHPQQQQQHGSTPSGGSPQDTDGEHASQDEPRGHQGRAVTAGRRGGGGGGLKMRGPLSEAGRRAQRRAEQAYRARKKERMVALEAAVAAMTLECRQLAAQRSSLEVTLRVLETAVRCRDFHFNVLSLRRVDAGSAWELLTGAKATAGGGGSNDGSSPAASSSSGISSASAAPLGAQPLPPLAEALVDMSAGAGRELAAGSVLGASSEWPAMPSPGTVLPPPQEMPALQSVRHHQAAHVHSAADRSSAAPSPSATMQMAQGHWMQVGSMLLFFPRSSCGCVEHPPLPLTNLFWRLT